MKLKKYFHTYGKKALKKVGQREKLGCDVISTKASANLPKNPEGDTTLQNFSEMEQRCQTFNSFALTSH